MEINENPVSDVLSVEPESAYIKNEGSVSSVQNRLSQEFIIKEYEALRKEIEQKIAIFEQLSRFGVISSAAAWGWIFTQQNVVGYNWLIFLPFVISTLFLFKVKALNDAVYDVAEYLALLESYLKKEQFLPEELGWESSLKKRRDIVASKSHKVIRLSVIKPLSDQTFWGNWDNVFWISLCTVNLMTAVYLLLFR